MSKADEIKDLGIEENEIENTLKFIGTANNVCKLKGKMYEFNCPICNSTAKAIKSDYNGHLWAKCEKCDMTIME